MTTRNTIRFLDFFLSFLTWKLIRIMWESNFRTKDLSDSRQCNWTLASQLNFLHNFLTISGLMLFGYSELILYLKLVSEEECKEPPPEPKIVYFQFYEGHLEIASAWCTTKRFVIGNTRKGGAVHQAITDIKESCFRQACLQKFRQ